MNTHEGVVGYVPRDPPKRASTGDLERWDVSLADSSLRFALRHIVVQKIHGQFRTWGGTLDLDWESPWLSTVRVWVDLASIDTDERERDDHIRSAEFLDVERFPRAEFTSTSIEPRADCLMVRGVLQLHGVTHDLDLEVRTRTRRGGHHLYDVRGTLNRQAFGLHWNQDLDAGGVVVGDDVELAAEIELVRPDEPDRGTC
jgi:polyisoprenoid-binding protein YceI